MAEIKVCARGSVCFSVSPHILTGLCCVGTHRRSRSELDLPVSAVHSVHENDVPLLDEQASDQADRDGKHSSTFRTANLPSMLASAYARPPS